MVRNAFTESLYDLPQYYDIAFSWDITREIELYRSCFERHAPFPVHTVLEPGCGTGRFLVSLPRLGYRVVGYDKNPTMVAYARKRIQDAGLQDAACAVAGDMRTARFGKEFDAAINSINTLGYLLTDDDIVAHLRNTGESLRREGVYVVQLACAWGKVEHSEGWTLERAGVRVQTVWEIEREDPEKKLSYQMCRMVIDDQGERRHLEDRHTLRLWYYDDLKSLMAKAGVLTLEAIYSERREEIPLDAAISGEMGNLYYVLKAI